MPDTHSVCYVNEQGELICGASSLVDTTAYQVLADDIVTRLGNIGPKKIALMIKLIAEVGESPLDDDCIGTRTTDTVESVHRVVTAAAPVMLLYRYHRLPGDILAAYYFDKAAYGQARDALEHWSTVKDAC